MTEQSPTPPNRQDPETDPAGDADEPAFEWMKPAAGKRAGTPEAAAPAAADSGRASDAAAPAATAPAGSGSRPAPADNAAAPAAAPARESAAGSALPVPGERQGRRADRRAVDAAPAGRNDAVFNESLPTSALQVRPPQEEVERRNAEREQAARAKPVAPRVMQVLLAVCFPVILLVAAVRAVTSPLFLWVEYNRPGFPGDGYGFNTDDRMTYGSYAVDYLGNWSGPRYLGELVNRSGEPLFREGEVSHMADVKLVILSAFGAGVLLALLSLIAILYLRRRSTGGVRRGLFAGSIVTLVLIIGLGVLAVLGWEQFFTEFHRIFFANGTWTFALSDTLIRLFPGQFWVDAGIVIGALVLIASLLTLILTWPTRRRRGLPPRTRKAAAAADPEDGSFDGANAANAANAADAADAPGPKGRRFKRARHGTGEANAAPGSGDDSPAGATDTGAAAGERPARGERPGSGEPPAAAKTAADGAPSPTHATAADRKPQ
ncbi:TIGR01906 family membrane protein [Arthrobacter sp. Hor0625]|uniref:TIGR01906 family membrane protein n=1 Tax=Arthrobacter sp. Hor0625 TaxID=3457358 RepID=UPI00403E4379